MQCDVMNFSIDTINNAMSNLEFGIEISKEEIELMEVIDTEDLFYCFDVNLEIVANARKIIVLEEMKNEILNKAK